MFAKFSALGLALALLAVGCGSPTGPSSRTSAISLPVVESPLAGLLIGDLDQPVTLTIQNPVASSNAATTMTFEVSSDAAFGATLVARTVPVGAGERTSLTLERLPPSATYFWRAYASAPGVTGTYSIPASFRIGPAIASGPYRMTIDATAAGCGDLFSSPIIVDAMLIRSAQSISFERPGNPFCGGFWGADCGGVSGTFTGRVFDGTAGFQNTEPVAPAGIIISAAALQAHGAANPDGTISGELTHRFGPDLIVETTSGTIATCHSIIPWTLAPR